MPCFDHGADSGVKRGPNIDVLLKVHPGNASDDPADVYIWELKNCGHTAPAQRRQRFSHVATLTVTKGFLCESVCRGQTSGDEVLYSSLVKVGQLKNIRPAPPGSGCG